MKNNSVAIVTGASQGIGRATAVRLARDFSAVVLAARNQDELQKTATAVCSAGAEPQTYALDLAEPQAAETVVNGTLDRFGRIDALLNIAGAVPQIDLFEMTDAQWAQVQTKLRALVPQLRMVSSENTALAQGLASGELVAAMSWRTTFASLNREHKPVAYLNPPGGMFTYVCGLVMHKDANEEKALALIDSGITDEAAVYMITHIADEPANTEAMKTVPDKVYQELQIPRDLETFLKSGTFQRPLKNKDKIVEAWTEIRSGVQ